MMLYDIKYIYIYMYTNRIGTFPPYPHPPPPALTVSAVPGSSAGVPGPNCGRPHTHQQKSKLTIVVFYNSGSKNRAGAALFGNLFVRICH